MSMSSTSQTQPQEQAKPARNPWIELLRIIAMVMIVTAHFTIRMNWGIFQPGSVVGQVLRRTITNFSGLGGTGLFFLITGYFLVKKTFKASRLITLWIHVLCYTLGIAVAVAIYSWIRTGSPATMLGQGAGLAHNLVMSVFPVLNSAYWFVTAYVMLLVLSPFVNTLFAAMSRQAMTVLVTLLGFLSVWPAITLFAGYWNDLGFALFSYCLGAWIRMYYNPSKPLRFRDVVAYLAVFCLGFALLFTVSILGSTIWQGGAEVLGWNTKFWISDNRFVLLPMLSVTALFLCSVRCNPPRTGSITTVIDALSKGVFGVYLIHTNVITSPLLWSLLNGLLVPFAATRRLQMLATIPSILMIFAVYLVLALVYEHLVVTPVTTLLMHGAKSQGRHGMFAS
ncbi:acyltransferase family protein [Bifidobacterium miconisargentati]|uniref:acyltransferase family protein n=1 Tax=Bifidobacterium miconisargentati TaxID=2834437 RepID=UPI001BDBF302|nr:acyltransferase [Bifidobacterium miconisargentati]MBW3091310.1 acyltransferase [Bifidobacterium miconisargentati]